MSETLEHNGLKYCAHFHGLTGVECLIIDIAARRLEMGAEHFCAGCAYPKCESVTTHRYGGTEACRWDGKYIYYCPLGLVFVASPLRREDKEPLALVAGPIVMGEPHDTLALRQYEPLERHIGRIPQMDAPRVNDLAEILAAAAAGISGLPHTPSPASESVMESIYSLREKLGSEHLYDDLIQFENRLRVLVRARNKVESSALLNELLGRIYFYSGFKLDIIKARALELVVILSRAAIEAGANIEEILAMNAHNIKDVEAAESIDGLGAFLTELLHRFISYSFDFTQAKHMDVVYKVMEYIKTNYMNKLTLEDIAKHAFLSRSYLSSTFKAETGKTLSFYINSVRIEKSKTLLSETPLSLLGVALQCGFEDQSYFSKVFRSFERMTPKEYRHTHYG